MKEFTFEVPGNPIAQPRHRSTVSGGKPRLYLPADHPIHAYKQAVALSAANSKPSSWPRSGPIEIELLFLMARPERLKTVGRVRHAVKPDADNLGKGFLDGAKAIWGDDAQVCKLTIEKWYAASGESPKTVALVRNLEDDACLEILSNPTSTTKWRGSTASSKR